MRTKAQGGVVPTATNDAVFQLVLGWIDQLKESHGGNPFPAPHLREVNSRELYSTNFCEYDPLEQGYGYLAGKFVILGKEWKQCGGHWMIWQDGTGLFIYRGWNKQERGWKDGVSQFYCEVRFFAFGCAHEMEQTRNLGNCLNEYQCKHCGIVEVVDSSD